MSSRSPSAWPRLSFTFLKSSRSRKRTVTGVPAPLGQRQRVAHPVAEQRPVGQPGERIVERLVGQLLLQPPPLAHVAGVEHDALHGRVVQQVGREDLGVQPGAVGLAEAPLDRAGDARRLRRVAEERGRPLAVIGVEQLGHGLPHHRRRIVAEHPRGRRAHEPDRAVRPGDDDDVGRVLHQRAETGLVLARRVLGQEPHVLPHGEELAQHHQAGHQQGPDGEPADRIGPRAERHEAAAGRTSCRPRGRAAG